MDLELHEHFASSSHIVSANYLRLSITHKSSTNLVKLQWNGHGYPRISLKDEIEAHAQHLIPADPEYMALEHTLREILKEYGLIDRGKVYEITGANIVKYKKDLEGVEEEDIVETRTKLMEYLALRKTGRVSIIRRVKHGLRKTLEGVARDGAKFINASGAAEEVIQIDKETEVEGSDEEELNAGVIDNEDEPDVWKGFAEDRVLIVQDNEEFVGILEKWDIFIKKWVYKIDEEVKDTDQICLKYVADPTISQGMSSRVLFARHLH
ncbi:hypothetical protein G6011_08503 [Alternaria panax]|uniref:Uncharacterized protein n=1 Tax=Alternaria panax TaxID=48097 RepID=A0AAD4FJA6_9PLEO|nr:hypothetical protein G6011_08503 [Alternaria panax]